MPSADFSEFPHAVSNLGADGTPHPHISEISLGKNTNILHTAAMFTLRLPSVEFVIFGSLFQSLGLIRGFCSSARGFASRLPSDKPSPICPCLLLVVKKLHKCILRRATGDFHPINSYSCQAHQRAESDPTSIVHELTHFHHSPNRWGVLAQALCASIEIIFVILRVVSNNGIQ